MQPLAPASTAGTPTAATPAPAPGPPASAAARPPSFDIVSIERSGQAVIAGRALPGDQVRVLDGDKPIGETTADARGEWVLVPRSPIPPGNRQLGIEARGRDGGAVRRSPDVVALSVGPPGPAGGDTSALAVLLPGEPGAAARILQQPQPAGEGPPQSLETADYGAADRLVLSGRAEPGARLNVYAGEMLLGTATADGSGKWSLTSPYRRPDGDAELRLDQLASDGGVVRRVAAPLGIPAAPVVHDGGTYVVERGNNLWLIARRVYGHGTQYTAIYRANQDQIRDPDLIYPGQNIKLPHR